MFEITTVPATAPCNAHSILTSKTCFGGIEIDMAAIALWPRL
jgi:hypothetical protein